MPAPLPLCPSTSLIGRVRDCVRHRITRPLRFLLTLGIGLIPAPAMADAPAALRVHVLDCGRMRGIPTAELLAEVPNPPSKIDMVNRCFLVEHPQGRLLWDTGFPRSFGYRIKKWAFAALSFGKSGVDLAAPLPDQLEALGLGVDDIDYLALSHIHWDHVGDANFFARSTWIIQEAELQWAFSKGKVDRPHVDPKLYRDLENADKRVLKAEDLDLFGDGSVVILSSPGHTPGHQSLLLDLPKNGPTLLSGDLYHNVLNRQHAAPPAFNTNLQQTRESMKRIEAIIDARNAELWIQHDPTSGPAAPALIE